MASAARATTPSAPFGLAAAGPGTGTADGGLHGA